MPLGGIPLAYSQAGCFLNYKSKLGKDRLKHCSIRPNNCSICAKMNK